MDRPANAAPQALPTSYILAYIVLIMSCKCSAVYSKKR